MKNRFLKQIGITVTALTLSLLMGFGPVAVYADDSSISGSVAGSSADASEDGSVSSVSGSSQASSDTQTVSESQEVSGSSSENTSTSSSSAEATGEGSGKSENTEAHGSSSEEEASGQSADQGQDKELEDYEKDPAFANLTPEQKAQKALESVWDIEKGKLKSGATEEKLKKAVAYIEVLEKSEYKTNLEKAAEACAKALKPEQTQQIADLPATGASEEAQKEVEGKPKMTNEELIKNQHIVHIAPVEEKYDFRFYLIKAKVGYAKEATSFLEEKKDDSRKVAEIAENGSIYILQDKKDGWYYVESGEARGYIKAELVKTGREAQAVERSYARKAEQAAKEGRKETHIRDYRTFATPTVNYRENKAFFAGRMTAYDRVIAKVYAVAKDNPVEVREDYNTKSRIIGLLNPSDLAYVILDVNEEWVYIESGNVRGFVKKEAIKTGKDVNEAVKKKGEDKYTTAKELIDPRENNAVYYTINSVRQGEKNTTNPIRDAILKTAAECIGNPYVWGGVSLEHGADCSGFVQTLFANYGIQLPRVAENQAQYGTQIPVEDAQAGDLIFFAKDGYVYHVALCTGKGTTIEAYGTEVGIIANTLDTEHAVWATRVIPEESEDTEETESKK